jgi:hypothetical protein
MQGVPFERAEALVRSYFETVIMGYLACDIRTLLNSELDDKEQGGCSAPLAMSVFAGMNQLGYLTSSKNSDEIVKTVQTEQCIKEFCKEWMQRIDPENYRKSTVQEIMVNFFRHGMAHQFISISLSAITRAPSQSTLLSVRIDRDGSKLYVLQVKILAQDFLKALDLIEKKLGKAKENDPQFILRFYERWDSQREKILQSNKDLFKKADRNITTDSDELINGSIKTLTSTTTTAPMSGEVSMTIDGSYCFTNRYVDDKE